jgi:hypothetical protein
MDARSIGVQILPQIFPPITVRAQNNEMSKNAQTRNHSGMVADAATVLAKKEAFGREIIAGVTRGMRAPCIKDIRVINTAPQ